MNVLSLFDGMSCGQIALNKLGFKVDNYYASEVDKYAIQVAKKNYPNTKHIGDVTKVDASELPKIDLLIGGSPCQGFSFAGKQLNFNDPRSKLFFEFIRLWKETKPKYFLLENVRMKQQSQDIISSILGVEPIEINSALVSAQNRKRLYWTNIPNVTQPADRNINLSDILEDCAFLNPAAIRGRRLNKDAPITQCLEVRKTYRTKSNCLTTVQKDNVLTTLSIGRHLGAYTNKLPFRYYTRTEYERLQTVPDGYTEAVSENQAKKMLGNGWTVDVIAHLLKNIAL